MSQKIDNKAGRADAKNSQIAPENQKKAAAPAAPGGRKKIKGSFKFVLGYAGRECCSISMGMIFLVGGSISDLSIPIFIGWVIDAINDNDYDRVGDLCLYMIIVIVVSQSIKL